MAIRTPPHLVGRSFVELAALEQQRMSGQPLPTFDDVVSAAHRAIDDAAARLKEKHGANHVRIEVSCEHPNAVAAMNYGEVTVDSGDMTVVTVTLSPLPTAD